MPYKYCRWLAIAPLRRTRGSLTSNLVRQSATKSIYNIDTRTHQLNAEAGAMFAHCQSSAINGSEKKTEFLIGERRQRLKVMIKSEELIDWSRRGE